MNKLFRTVSVLMSVFNGEKYLRVAVDSILAQTFTDFEFVIVNDGSQDRSAEILSSYNDPRVTVINQKNKGLAGALNCGLQRCTSNIVVRMDADDVAYPERLRILLEDWEKAGRPDVFGSSANYINAGGRLLWGIEMPTGHDQIKSAILAAKGMMLIHPSVLFDKHAVLSCGGYDESFRSCEDYELWLRMSDYCRFGNSPRRLLKYRFVPDSMTAMTAISVSNLDKTAPLMRLLALQKKDLLNKGLEDIWTNNRLEITSLLLEKYAKTDLAHRFIVGRRMTESKINYYSGLKFKALREMFSILTTHPCYLLKTLSKRNLVSLPSLILQSKELLLQQTIGAAKIGGIS